MIKLVSVRFSLHSIHFVPKLKNRLLAKGSEEDESIVDAHEEVPKLDQNALLRLVGSFDIKISVEQSWCEKEICESRELL